MLEVSECSRRVSNGLRGLTLAISSQAIRDGQARRSGPYDNVVIFLGDVFCPVVNLGAAELVWDAGYNGEERSGDEAESRGSHCLCFDRQGFFLGGSCKSTPRVWNGVS